MEKLLKLDMDTLNGSVSVKTIKYVDDTDALGNTYMKEVPHRIAYQKGDVAGLDLNQSIPEVTKAYIKATLWEGQTVVLREDPAVLGDRME